MIEERENKQAEKRIVKREHTMLPNGNQKFRSHEDWQRPGWRDRDALVSITPDDLCGLDLVVFDGECGHNCLHG